MWIVSADEKQALQSDDIQRLVIVQKSDAALIVASYSSGNDLPPVTMGRYRDTKEAKDALFELVNAAAGGQAVFYMPDTVLFHEELKKRDARTRRKGGS